MTLSGMKIIITGGAGFIGSHLVDRLITNNKVAVIDDLSSGTVDNIRQHLDKPNFKLYIENLVSSTRLREIFRGVDFVFHLAANRDVRIGSEDFDIDFEQNVIATKNVLDAMHTNNVSNIVFTSTSTVYGEAEQIPTPEDYGHMFPISLYGSSKLAAEALIIGFSQMSGGHAWIFRLANIIGTRSNHGVIPDFIKKLRENPREIKILGDGNQIKSYLEIDDCVSAILHTVSLSNQRINVYNLGSEDQIDVKTIAKIIVEEADLSDVKFRYVNAEGDGRGWRGDVKNMLLDLSKLKKLGWSPRYSSEEAVRRTARSIIAKKPLRK